MAVLSGLYSDLRVFRMDTGRLDHQNDKYGLSHNQTVLAVERTLMHGHGSRFSRRTLFRRENLQVRGEVLSPPHLRNLPPDSHCLYLRALHRRLAEAHLLHNARDLYLGTLSLRPHSRLSRYALAELSA